MKRKIDKSPNLLSGEFSVVDVEKILLPVVLEGVMNLYGIPDKRSFIDKVSRWDLSEKDKEILRDLITNHQKLLKEAGFLEVIPKLGSYIDEIERISVNFEGNPTSLVKYKNVKSPHPLWEEKDGLHILSPDIVWKEGDIDWLGVWYDNTGKLILLPYLTERLNSIVYIKGQYKKVKDILQEQGIDISQIKYCDLKLLDRDNNTTIYIVVADDKKVYVVRYDYNTDSVLVYAENKRIDYNNLQGIDLDINPISLKLKKVMIRYKGKREDLINIAS